MREEADGCAWSLLTSALRVPPKGDTRARESEPEQKSPQRPKSQAKPSQTTAREQAIARAAAACPAKDRGEVQPHSPTARPAAKRHATSRECRRTRCAPSNCSRPLSCPL